MRRAFELLRLSIENLNRRKGRALLTATGVVIGTAAVVVLVSLGLGLQRNANQSLVGIGDLTVIQVFPNYGEGPIVSSGPGPGGGGSSPLVILTPQSLLDFAGLPGVSGVYARDFVQAGYILNLGKLEGWGQIIGLDQEALDVMALQALQGEARLAPGTVIVGSAFTQNLYDPRPRPGQESAPPENLLDQTIKLTLMKWSQDGVETRKVIPLRVAGVLAETRGEPDWSLYMTLEEVTAINQWASGRRVDRHRDGYPMANVKVAELGRVLEVYDQIVAMGYFASTPQSFVEGINSFYLVLQIIFGGVGAIALLVAAIGIANTMAMAILERTREIGLMKAIGATNRDVLGVFLYEAAGIGFLGGLGGVSLGWIAGQVINVVALAYMAGQAAGNGGPPPPGLAVHTPLWLPVFALVFATLIGLLSGLIPALRAATLQPVAALKYE
jgi:putative ABC transport system permease protein